LSIPSSTPIRTIIELFCGTHSAYNSAPFLNPEGLIICAFSGSAPSYDRTTVESESHRESFQTEAVQSATAAVSRDLTKSRTAPWDFCISGTPADKDDVRDQSPEPF
jgi:hypothetical protein